MPYSPAEEPDFARRSAHTTVAAVVRREALSSAIGAALLLYFGFRAPWTTFGLPGEIMVYSIQWGGIAMAFTTVLLLIGWRWALAADGLVAIAIGAGMCIGGLPGFDLLMLIFGGLFISSGVRGLRFYRELGAVVPEYGESSSHVATQENVPFDVPARQRERVFPVETPPERFTHASHAQEPLEPAEDTDWSDGDDSSTEAEWEEPPEGYLSSFAEPEDRPREP